MPETTKAWYKSKGIWAGVLTSVLGIYSLLRAYIQALPDLTPFYPIAITLLGALGVYGRVDASGKIAFSDQKSN